MNDLSNNLDQNKSSNDLPVNDEDPILLRLVYAILFYFIYVWSRLVVGGVAVIQFLHVLLAQEPQPDLVKFSRSLNRFISQLIAYLTWTSHQKPFPFSDWPSDENQDDSSQ